jgi:hypothetical protein
MTFERRPNNYPQNTDRELRELIGQHVERRRVAPVAADAGPDATVEPVGMSVTEQVELIRLLKMADASRDGDEQAAIERLVSALDTTYQPIGA